MAENGIVPCSSNENVTERMIFRMKESEARLKKEIKNVMVSTVTSVLIAIMALAISLGGWNAILILQRAITLVRIKESASDD